MKRYLSRLVAFALLLGSLALAIPARAETVDDYMGIWEADGVTVEIWREGADREVCCRVVFTDGDEDSDVWSYTGCWYDASEKILWCNSVTRTHQHFDKTWEMLSETDWSLNDMDFSQCVLTDAGLRFSCDDRDVAVDVVKLEGDGSGAREAALAFLGLWKSDFATLKVDDYGVAYLFTITAPVNADSDCRWTYTCRYDAGTGRMASVDVSPRTMITRTADGGYTEEEVGRDASEAVFTLDDGQLVFSDVTDGDGEDMAFERTGD